ADPGADPRAAAERPPLEGGAGRRGGGGPRPDQDVRALAGQLREGLGHGGRVVVAIAHGEEARAEPVDLLGEGGLEAGALLRLEARAGQRADLLPLEALHPDAAPGRPRALPPPPLP